MNLSLLQFFNGLAGKIPFLKELAVLISKPIGYIPLILIALGPIFLTARNKTYWLILSAGTLGGAWLVSYILKIIFRIARPVDGVGEILVLIKQNGYSFPSGHASVFASLAVLGWYYDVRLGIILTALALFVGISRSVAGVHYPLDVFAGFCVGILVGITMCTLGKKYL
jgi:undecaprenyl-diphosphatase